MNRLARLLNSSTDGQDLASLALQEAELRIRCQALRELLAPAPGKKMSSFSLARLATLETQLEKTQEQLKLKRDGRRK